MPLWETESRHGVHHSGRADFFLVGGGRLAAPKNSIGPTTHFISSISATPQLAQQTSSSLLIDITQPPLLQNSLAITETTFNRKDQEPSPYFMKPVEGKSK